MSLTLARTHIEAERRLRATTMTAVANAWLALASYDEENVPAFLAIVAPLVTAAQRQSVALTSAYLARAVRSQPVPLDIKALTGAALRGGTTPQEVYRRPFVDVWTGLKNGTPYEQAVQTGLQRATSSAEMDVQLAMRQTVRAVAIAEPRIVGYRRVPNPGACDLCLLAAKNIYRVGDLMPIHTRCGCGVAPITSSSDPAADAQLEREPAGDVQVATEQHGELGPVLVPAGQTFTQL